jgi:hypothetical protein
VYFISIIIIIIKRIHLWLEQFLSLIGDLFKSVLQAIGLSGPKDAIKLDLTRDGLRVEKAKVGPLGSALFDSAISISSDTE